MANATANYALHVNEPIVLATLRCWCFEQRLSTQMSQTIIIPSRCQYHFQESWYAGNCCGSVGRVIASVTKGLPSESSRQDNFIMNSFTVTFWKDNNKEKRDLKWPILFKKSLGGEANSCLWFKIRWLG